MNELIYDKNNIKLWNGDTLEVLKGMPDESMDMAITSPPYFGLRIYIPKNHPDYKQQLGLENSYQDYLAKMLLITAEIKRVLKKTGSFWLNCGDAYASNASMYDNDGKVKQDVSNRDLLCRHCHTLRH